METRGYFSLANNVSGLWNQLIVNPACIATSSRNHQGGVNTHLPRSEALACVLPHFDAPTHVVTRPWHLAFKRL